MTPVRPSRLSVGDAHPGARGVLLYELLAGTTPLDRKRLKQAAFVELLRLIREEEPPKPSMRLSEAKDSLPSVSAVRQMEPAKLTRLVKGELDWIVMKALEKDRNRRYETANGLAQDVQRYLHDGPGLSFPVLRLRLRFSATHSQSIPKSTNEAFCVETIKDLWGNPVRGAQVEFSAQAFQGSVPTIGADARVIPPYDTTGQGANTSTDRNFVDVTTNAKGMAGIFVRSTTGSCIDVVSENVGTRNGGDGILIVNSANNTIGDSAAGDENTISGNQQSGIHITGERAVRREQVVYKFACTIPESLTRNQMHLQAEEAHYVRGTGPRRGGWEMTVTHVTGG